MPYEPEKDPYHYNAATADSPARNAVLITPADANLAAYAKALRVYVPAAVSEASVRVTPIDAADDANYITLKFPTGLWIEPIAVRRVWSTGLTAGIEIHGYTK